MGVYSNNPGDDMGMLGGVLYCAHPQAQPVLISVFMMSFLLIVALVIVMLIIGTIGDAMVKASLDMKRRTTALRIAYQQKTARDIIKWHERLRDYDRKGAFHLIRWPTRHYSYIHQLCL